MTTQIRKLEGELARKEKALAEAATLRVLRETIECQIQKKGEDIAATHETAT